MKNIKLLDNGYNPPINKPCYFFYYDRKEPVTGWAINEKQVKIPLFAKIESILLFKGFVEHPINTIVEI
jgi:hypothetical protein